MVMQVESEDSIPPHSTSSDRSNDQEYLSSEKNGHHLKPESPSIVVCHFIDRPPSTSVNSTDGDTSSCSGDCSEEEEERNVFYHGVDSTSSDVIDGRTNYRYDDDVYDGNSRDSLNSDIDLTLIENN